MEAYFHLPTGRMSDVAMDISEVCDERVPHLVAIYQIHFDTPLDPGDCMRSTQLLSRAAKDQEMPRAWQRKTQGTWQRWNTLGRVDRSRMRAGICEARRIISSLSFAMPRITSKIPSLDGFVLFHGQEEPRVLVVVAPRRLRRMTRVAVVLLLCSKPPRFRSESILLSPIISIIIIQIIIMMSIGIKMMSYSFSTPSYVTSSIVLYMWVWVRVTHPARLGPCQRMNLKRPTNIN